MDVLVKYLRSTGLVDGMYTASGAGMLEAQIVEGDPTYGYLLTVVDDALGTRELIERYAVVGGALTEKALLTIVADPMQFTADGIDECLISVEPIVACTLRVNGMARELTTADPILELTTDTPMQFVVTLEPMATHWAEPLTVEAV